MKSSIRSIQRINDMSCAVIKLLSLAVLMAALVTGSQARAGSSGTNPVYVSKIADGSGFAFGDLRGTRSSDDHLQQIQCSSYNTPTGNQSLFCYVADANYNTLSCYSNSTIPGFSNLRQALSQVSSASGIGFQVDASGRCTSLWVNNGSFNLP